MSSRAPASCFSCRRSKRRCDKNLPTCQLCSQKGVKCSYPRRRGQSSPSPTRSVQGSDYDTGSNSPYTRELVAVPRSTGSQYNSASSVSSPFAVTTAIRFLAPDVFREARLEIPRLDVGIPDEVAYHLGDNHQVRETASKFFQESWLPIISRKRYLAAILNPLSPSRRPTALLALCMKLCCSSAYDEESPRKNSLYKLVKKFYSEVESTQDLCVEVLQAAILIAIFEIGDAVYPAAYLTVGVCARYGIAMGLDKINKDRMGERYDRMGSWMEIEERRRAWWAILILDRFLNFANPSRVLATEDPAFEDFLPVDDDKFYDATSQPDEAVPICQGFVFKMGHFGRLAQATYLISQALVMIRSLSVVSFTRDESILSQETVQLCRTLEALVRANEMEITVRRLAFCCQSLVSYGGVLLLQESYWAQLQVRTQEELQQHTFIETRNAIDTLCQVSSVLQQRSNMVDLLKGQCTFFLAGVTYQAVSALMTMGKGNPSAEMKESIILLRWLLRHIRSRWPLSGVYDSILDAKEALLAADAI